MGVGCTLKKYWAIDLVRINGPVAIYHYHFGISRIHPNAPTIHPAEELVAAFKSELQDIQEVSVHCSYLQGMFLLALLLKYLQWALGGSQTSSEPKQHGNIFGKKFRDFAVIWPCPVPGHGESKLAICTSIQHHGREKLLWGSHSTLELLHGCFFQVYTLPQYPQK